MKSNLGLLVPLLLCIASAALAETRFVQIEAHDRNQRTTLVNDGMSIEFVRTDSAWGFANEKAIEKLQKDGFKILSNLPREIGRGGHEDSFEALGFPSKDDKYHTFDQVVSILQNLAEQNKDIARLQSIGKTIEGRDLWVMHINSTPDALQKGTSNKPGVIFMGNHHAREHLSIEVPLMLIQHLLTHRSDAHIASLLNSKDIWILPMVNPDGAEFDISTGSYKYWRKNRKENGDGTYGVDLNRNYSFKWGTGGSSTDTDSDIYMGKEPFSEPETQAVRDFVTAHANTSVLLSFHSYSELVLYPWGHKFDQLENKKDLAVFQKMAQTMADWNHYTAEQTSELYIASGDTTDWAYGEKGIFAFTIELSPNGGFGGFYPGNSMIDKAFQDNLKPCLYLIETAGNPYQVLENHSSEWLPNLVEHEVTQSNL